MKFCVFVGPETGELRKKSCKSQPTIVEHRCNHPEMQMVLPRSGVTIGGRCTPSGTSHEFKEGLPIQPCKKCKYFK